MTGAPVDTCRGLQAGSSKRRCWQPTASWQATHEEQVTRRFGPAELNGAVSSVCRLNSGQAGGQGRAGRWASERAGRLMSWRHGARTWVLLGPAAHCPGAPPRGLQQQRAIQVVCKWRCRSLDVVCRKGETCFAAGTCVWVTNVKCSATKQWRIKPWHTLPSPATHGHSTPLLPCAHHATPCTSHPATSGLSSSTPLTHIALPKGMWGLR